MNSEPLGEIRYACFRRRICGNSCERTESVHRRNIDNLTFRVLNFILYSHIFYSNVIGILSDEEIKNLKIEGMSIFNILEEDYRIIQVLIKDINHIKDINEFMNILYYTLGKDIDEKIFEKKEKRDEYEKRINNTIDSCILINTSDIFRKLKSNYKNNINYLNLNKKSLKKIVHQYYSPNENEYINHPYLKEFVYDYLRHNCFVSTNPTEEGKKQLIIS